MNPIIPRQRVEGYPAVLPFDPAEMLMTLKVLSGPKRGELH